MPHGRRFVGREAEVAALLGSLRDAAGGTGGIALIAGEPGVGKTRLAAEVARLAEAELGAVALWGRCPEAEGAPAFWPWRQILLEASEQPDLGPLHEAQELLVQSPASAGEGTPAQKRFEVFEKIAAALRAAARRRPLLLILDDLHWADHSSIKLAHFVAAEMRGGSGLLLPTFREVEPSSAPGVANLLSELAGLGRTVPLRGLSVGEVAELMAELAGVEPPSALVEKIYEATQGNPFFVDETVRLLIAERRLDGDTAAGLPIPLGVRAALSRRIQALGEDVRLRLTACAVGGREIDLAVMARATRLRHDSLLGSLEMAERLGLLSRPSDHSRFSFVQALVRETLYESLPETDRALWHRRIGEAIEAVYPRDPEPHLAELAHHFGAAARAGDGTAKAVAYGLRAGEAALEQLAFEKAELELGRTLSLLEPLDEDSLETRCRIVLGIAAARRGAGDIDGMMESFREGIDLARRVSASTFADAVIHLAMARHESFFVDQLLVGLLEEALERLPREPSALRARCLARLAATLHLDPAAARRRVALTEEATAMARSLGEPSTLAWVLMMRIIAHLGPETLEERLRLAGEIQRISDQTGDVVAMLEAQTWRIHDLLELGDIEAVRLAIRSFTRLAQRLGQPVYLWHVWHVATWCVMQALLDGDLPRAEELLAEALSVGQRAQQQSAILRYGEGLLMLRYEQGRMRELEGLVRMGVDQAPEVPSWRIALASMHVENERPEEARVEVERLAANDFRDLPRDANWLFGMVSLAHIVCELGLEAPARSLYALLVPYAGRMTATRPAVVFSGGVSHFLGRLAALAGDAANARRHLDDALREHQQLGSVPWATRSQVELARFLLVHGGNDELPRALALANEAQEVAGRLGLDEIRPRAEKVLERVRERERRMAPASARTEGPNAFVREGDYWRVVFQGSELRVRDLTGIRQIARLLRHPGEQLSVLDLLDVGTRRREDTGVGGFAGAPLLCDAGEVLDRRARAEYREEIASLESELEEARSFNDLGRVRSLEARIAVIHRELSRALGLGGRPRRTRAPIERARVSVTRTIRDAIRRLEALDPRLGRLLDESIHTGRFCCYRPALGQDLVWQVS